MKYIRNNSFVLRSIMDKNMLFPTGQMTQEMQGSIILNDIAALIWNSMEEYVDKEYLLTKILHEYDVDKEQAMSDLENLLNVLCDNALIFTSNTL